jgi:DeoR/GlpR family transcriptional regulator of sugar metabolism
MKMFVTERRAKIMQLLYDKQRLTVKDLAGSIGVSEATLRSDLNKMESDGLLVRTHGGAVLKENNDNDTSFSVRKQKNRNEKMKIAEKAVELISDKQCVLLDASSTALEIARLLKKNPLRVTVVTSGIYTALELADTQEITVIQIGGVVTNGSSSIEGILGLDILDQVNIDMMFTSANGFSFESGLTDFNLYEVALKKEMVKRAGKVVALIDTSKIGKNSSAFFCKVNEIDTFITEAALDTEVYEKLVKHDINVISF